MDKNGRMGTNISPKGGLLETPQGLAVNPAQAGEMNRPQMQHIGDIEDTVTVTAAEVAEKLNALLTEMRRTGRVRGGF